MRGEVFGFDRSGTQQIVDCVRRVRQFVRPRQGRPKLPNTVPSRPNLQWVAITSLTTISGRYPGFWYVHNSSDNTLTQQDAVWVMDPNGGTPQIGFYYLARQDDDANGLAVYSIEDVMGGGTVTIPGELVTKPLVTGGGGSPGTGTITFAPSGSISFPTFIGQFNLGLVSNSLTLVFNFGSFTLAAGVTVSNSSTETYSSSYVGVYQSGSTTTYQTGSVVNIQTSVTYSSTYVGVYQSGSTTTYQSGSSLTISCSTTYGSTYVGVYQTGASLTISCSTTYGSTYVGTYQSGSTTTFQTGSVVNIQTSVTYSSTYIGTYQSGSTTTFQSGSTVNFAGTVNITAGSWTFQSGSTITVNVGSTLTINGVFILPVVGTKPVSPGTSGQLICGGSFIYQYDGGGGTWETYSPDPTTTTGDLIIGITGSKPVALAAGTLGNILTSNGPGNQPSWQAPVSGGDKSTTSYAGTTAAAAATLFDIVDNNGWVGSFVIKNLDATNHMQFRTTTTDMYGNVDASAWTILFPSAYQWWDAQNLQIATAYPPYKEIKVEVQDNTGHCAYQAYLMHDT